MATRAVPPRIRALVVLVATSALLAVPFQALAIKGDNIAVTVRPDRAMTAASVSTSTSPSLLKFDVSLHNGGNATLTSLRFDGRVRTVAQAGTDATYRQAAGATCSALEGGLAARCQFGNIPAGGSVSFSIFYQAPTTAGPVYLDGVFTSDARQGNPQSTSSDTWTDQVVPSGRAIDILARGGEFYGTWQFAHGAQLPAIEVVGSDQRTRVDVPAVPSIDYPLVVQQTADPRCGGVTVGRAVGLSVAKGAQLAQPLRATITYGPAAAGGAAPNQINLLHIKDDDSCVPVPRGCRSTSTFCYDAAWTGSGPNKSIQLSIRLPSNGVIKGWR